MLIRAEVTKEFPAIYEFVKLAFQTAQVADGDEQEFVNRLRASDNYLPELALVAEDNGQVVGHIMLTKTILQNATRAVSVLLLAPLAVALDYRKQGVGSALIKESFNQAKAMGYQAVFLVGDPAYYQRFGFKSITEFGIGCALDIPLQYIQACELQADALKDVGGIIKII